MPYTNKNALDFPLNGLLGFAVKKIIPQRDPKLNTSLVHTAPSQTFMGLVKSILEGKDVKWFLISGYLCEAVYAAIFVMLPFVLGQFVNLIIENDVIHYADIIKLCAFTATLLTLNTFVNFISVRQADRARAIGEAHARRQLTWWALGHSTGWFSGREAGQISYRISEVSRQVNVVFGYVCWDVAPILVSLIVVSAIMYSTDLYAGLFFTAWTILFLFQSIKLGLISQKFMMRTVKRRTEASGMVTDAIINNALVRLFDTKKLEDEKVNYHSQQCFEAFMESSTWARIKNAIRDISLLVLITGMIWILGTGLMHDRIAPAAFVSGMGALFVLITQVKSLHHVIRDLMEAIGAVREGLIEIGTPHDITDNISSSITLDPQKKDIELEHVNFSYHRSKLILHDINLIIPEGQKIGIVGLSGAGKTTLMALLLRLWDTSAGTVKIAGHNVKDIPSYMMRKQMALIPQDTSLLHRSLMDNIRYGRLDASNEEVIEAAKKAHAHEFISELEKNYETLVGERGIKLSGGQRQRIAIARAILKDAPILILDEATSALDSESERLIQDSLKGLMDGKTVIAIAHRLSTIAHLDRIIVMDRGKIVEDGTHDDLLKQNGTYAKLWDMQSGGFLGE